jgi:hypothetical protein
MNSTTTRGMSLSEALRVIAEHHPHWHIWRTEHLVWGTRCLSADGGSGTTLDAPTPERLDQVLAAWEHKYRWPA